ncbi:MAG: hypothetical protein ACK5QC_08790 [Bacteroidota bacterium]
MKKILSIILLSLAIGVLAQTNTFSPYSRYGIGELNQANFAHVNGMGGANVALRFDTTAPLFINVGNPASYAFIRITSLEVGANGFYGMYKNSSSALNKYSLNFSYGTLGFPIAKNGGACIGMMPLTSVGYNTESITNSAGIGDVKMIYNGEGGLNKAFIGYGISPFNKRLRSFRKNAYVKDSLRFSRSQFKSRYFISKFLNDFTIGANVNYIFGSIQHNTNVIYPNSLLYLNTKREQTITMGDFTGNFGVQSAITIDSIYSRSTKRAIINKFVKNYLRNGGDPSKVNQIKDSLNRIVKVPKIQLAEKLKFTIGYFYSLNNTLNAIQSTYVYNYVLGSTGNISNKDSIIKISNQKGTVVLPLEQAFGIGFKKGERINVVADFGITNWSNFKLLDSKTTYQNNYRISLGANYVQNKQGNYRERINYRAGFTYNTGYLDLQNSLLPSYFISAGVGFPVGVFAERSMVNLSLQYGKLSTENTKLFTENYFRLHLGFTFSARWFQKFRYD